MSLIAQVKHSQGNLIEGQLAFTVVDSSATTVPIYHVSTKKSGTNVIAMFFDVRAASNAARQYMGASKDYLRNLGIPEAFIALITDSSGVQTPEGTGQVTIPATSMATIGQAGLTDVTIASVVGSTPSVPTAPSPTGQPTAPSPTGQPTAPSPAGTPTPATPEAPKATQGKGLFGMSMVLTVVVGVALAIASVFGYKQYQKNAKKGGKK